MSEQLAHYQKLHQQVRAQLPAAKQQQADAAWQQFVAFDFPKARHEAWKYTNVRSLFTANYELIAADNNAATLPKPLAIADQAIVIRFVDGQLDLAASSPLSAGIIFAPLADLPQALQQRFVTIHSQSLGQEASFAYLNQALAQQAYGLYIPKTPQQVMLQLEFVATGAAHDCYQAPNITVLLDVGARASIVESYTATAAAVNHNYFVNPLLRYELAANSYCEHVKLINDGASARHVANQLVEVGEAANWRSFHALLGGKLLRDDLSVNLAGEHAQANLAGIYLGSGKQHQDSHCLVNHQVPHGSSKQFYRGIFTDHARGVFDSKAWVADGAIKSLTKQTNNNLLLSEHAEIDTKPELQIYNDDVSCAHGATVGELSQSQLFYLQSRGLDAQAARHMLTSAFAGEVVNEIEHETVRAWMTQVVEEHLLQLIFAETK